MAAASRLQTRIVSINSIRLDRVCLGRILDGLDRGQGGLPSNRRGSSRLRYRIGNAIVFPTDSERLVAFVVPTRNLSGGGLAFLHSQMMYVGRPVAVQLPVRGGGWIRIEAKVVRCRHVRAMVHEVAVQFDRPLDLQRLQAGSPQAVTV